MLQNQRWRHTPSEGTLRDIFCLIACLGLGPYPGIPGHLVINAQGRVNLAFVVFRANQSQDAGPSGGATGVSASVDGVSVGSQDLNLKDLGGAGHANFLPSCSYGGVWL